MKLGIAQLAPHPGDFKALLSQVLRYSEEAKSKQCDLLVFPGGFLAGSGECYVFDSLGFIHDELNFFTTLKEKISCPCLVSGGFFIGHEMTEDYFLITSDSIIPVRYKSLVDAFSKHQEVDVNDFSRSLVLPEFEFCSYTFGIVRSTEELNTLLLRDTAVDVVLFLQTQGFVLHDPDTAMGSALLENRYISDAVEADVWLAGISAVGLYDFNMFCGSSFVISPRGKLCAQAPILQESLLLCDLDQTDTDEDPFTNKFLDPYEPALMGIHAITKGIHELAQYMECDRACVLLDTKISSFLVCSFLCDALGADQVFPIMYRQSDVADFELMWRFITDLKIPFSNVEVFDVKDGIVLEDIKDYARARLCIKARSMGALAVTGDDKTSRALGLVPLCSDSVCMPLADLYCCDIYRLAYIKNSISYVIPMEKLFASLPDSLDIYAKEFSSGELFEDFVDFVLLSYVEQSISLKELIEVSGHADLVSKIISIVLATEKNRTACPLYLKLSHVQLDTVKTKQGLLRRTHPGAETPENVAHLMAELFDPARIGGVSEEDHGDVAYTDTNDTSEISEDVAMSDELSLPENPVQQIQELMGYIRDFSFGGVFDMDNSFFHDSSGLQEGIPIDLRKLFDEGFSEN